MRRKVWLAVSLTLLLVSCASILPQNSEPEASETLEVGQVAEDAEEESAPEEAESVLPEDNEADSTEPDEQDQEIVLTVWTTDAVVPTGGQAGGDILIDQLASFDQQFPNIRVDVLTKRLNGTGGILSYLRSAPPVAPGVVPDLVLLDREALIQASEDELIFPVGEAFPEDEVANWYTVATDLATVDGQLVGVPYVLDAQHVVYRASLFSSPPNSFEAALDSPVPFVFPANSLSTVNHTLLMQYLAAGGLLADEEGQTRLSENVLANVLFFYTQAIEEGNIDGELFALTENAESWALYREGRAAFAVVSASQYLAESEDVRNTQATWVPTFEGNAITLVTGWSWAIVTPDPDRQQAARDLLTFLMNADNQGEYTEAGSWLPTQPDAFTSWQNETYADFAHSLLEAAQLLPSPATLSEIGPPMQDALESVIQDELDAFQAARNAVEAVNPSNTPEP
ncbi:MAG: extracellular solute-binding protein [Chloroflexi bacterium]|nr:extracellular solute-binding protein [Chloroflexota bacterium]